MPARKTMKMFMTVLTFSLFFLPYAQQGQASSWQPATDLPQASGEFKRVPQLKLFPMSVTEHLSNTGEAAAAMENNLKEVITELKAQEELFTSTGCEGMTESQGCDDIARQMGDSYMKMIDIMERNLPEMENSVAKTNKAVARTLRSEIGKKASPADVQRLLGQQSQRQPFKGRYSLSKRFEDYKRLVSSGNDYNLATLAAEIYLDSLSVKDMIAVMKGEIAQQKTLHKMGSMYGTLTPDMTTTVDRVKILLFGEPDEGSTHYREAETAPKKFVSPLEMG